MWRSDKYLRLMRELPCAHCGLQDGTVVAAHRNEGKGMGLKNSDALVIPLCYTCHMEFDQGKEMSREGRRHFWNNCYIETIQNLIEQGYLVIAKGK